MHTLQISKCQILPLFPNFCPALDIIQAVLYNIMLSLPEIAKVRTSVQDSLQQLPWKLAKRIQNSFSTTHPKFWVIPDFIGVNLYCALCIHRFFLKISSACSTGKQTEIKMHLLVWRENRKMDSYNQIAFGVRLKFCQEATLECLCSEESSRQDWARAS